MKRRQVRPLLERLMARVVKDDATGCWIWTGALVKGYGRIGRGRAGTGQVATHRAAYEMLRGYIPAGFHLDHLCRNPPCCNPDHLEPVTPAENARRYGRTVTHCPRGHAYDEANTYVQKTAFGGVCKVCRVCQSARRRARRLAGMGASA